MFVYGELKAYISLVGMELTPLTRHTFLFTNLSQ